MNLPVSFTITVYDINLGDKVEASTCPAAKALRRTIKKRNVLVYGDELRVNGVRYAMPEGLLPWTKTFDRGEPVKPATFVLERQLTPTEIAKIERASKPNY